MSDITHARKAAELADVDVDVVAERLTKATVQASLAVASAAREVDTTIRQRFISLEKALTRPNIVEQWVVVDEVGPRRAINSDHIVEFVEGPREDETTVTLSTGESRVVPVAFGHVALQVGV